MGYCFCIEPFGEDVSHRLFNDVFVPAIEDAGMEAYRVERNSAMSTSNENIERAILGADLCVADVATNAPNVWYELGYGIGCARNAVLVCSDQRSTPLPFSFPRHQIIQYRSASRSIDEDVQHKITHEIISLHEKDEAIFHASRMILHDDASGLSQHEACALVAILQDSLIEGRSSRVHFIAMAMKKAGFTPTAVSLALRSLTKREFIGPREDMDQNGYGSAAYVLLDLGKAWLAKHEREYANSVGGVFLSPQAGSHMETKRLIFMK